MKELLEAIKDKDLVKAKKVFAESMKEKQSALKEAKKIELAQSVVIEGEEPEDNKEDDKKSKEDNKESEKSKEAKENDKKTK